MKAKDKGCLKVMGYNAMMQSQWRTDCEAKSKDGRWAQMPQLAFYLFLNTSGAYRKTGYVAFSGNTAVLRTTKREAVAYLEMQYGLTIR